MRDSTIGLARQYGPLIAKRDLGGWMCAYCYRRLPQKVEYRPYKNFLGTHMRAVIHGGMASIDHVVPVSLGGPNHIDNYVLCCRSCNTRKGNRLPGEYSIHPKGK